MKPVVSVVITTRNRAAFLKEALDSVFAVAVSAQDFSLEVVVVDDGSTDGTSDLLAGYTVTLLRAGGIGMARARNLGLAAITGDFVTLLDDDDVWLPNNIGAQLRIFAEHPEYGSVHAQSQLTDHALVPYGEPVPSGPLPSGWLFESLLSYMPQVDTIVTRASVAKEAGDFDPTLTGDTDWDWLLRIARAHPIGRVAEPVMLFRQRSKPELDTSWKRYPATVRIFKQHTAGLAFVKRARLQRVLWRHRGLWTSRFIDCARLHSAEGDPARAIRSLYCAFRCSPPHSVMACLRALPLSARWRGARH